MSEINVLEHELVPEHRLLDPEVAKTTLDELDLTPDQLPKIKVHDPCIRMLEMATGHEIPKGSIVRVNRESLTAGVITSYRVVVD